MNGGKRREAREIMYEILKSAQTGKKKTPVMYESKLNLKALNLYLGELIQTELLVYAPQEKFYQTTERGKTFARAFERYRETIDLVHVQEGALGAFLNGRGKNPVLLRHTQVESKEAPIGSQAYTSKHYNF